MTLCSSLVRNANGTDMFSASLQLTHGTQVHIRQCINMAFHRVQCCQLSSHIFCRHECKCAYFFNHSCKIQFMQGFVKSNIYVSQGLSAHYCNFMKHLCTCFGILVCFCVISLLNSNTSISDLSGTPFKATVLNTYSRNKM
jgi:hypothetical protein